ncbi:ribonucleoside-diphosphate reductase subunit alpha [Priestia filamentosa]|uniref:Ribonucleoside-diphosphate reductase n=1 Tax=Priestia filamentosa TaxID=1402861 RepID=A0A1X7F9X2_9BACI|nr:ribonucleoside-diphosphate reductase subunit alpha [Priestia filamentosa]AKO91858.1 ribonucleoside-diphosphate reductase subunit alpha [Priestia filamentosa]MDT3762004.1 ribonucleoside-diphosphate reductase subunit alpha [Priestia filamentosa]OXS68088.1 ribonucleoside-diphosphate reductase subunit alpha [Priestia filamentosa]WCM17092.1 ribonucleoside-diphosphate reductase subunit alpha [Priestia filamentosa]WRU96504.1 ribonucleoside-diphosphate reductase subunit alpha [Priestia filamentosa]
MLQTNSNTLETVVEKDGAEEALVGYLEKLKEKYPHLDFDDYEQKIVQGVFTLQKVTRDRLSNLLILGALERINTLEPDWTYVAASVLLDKLYGNAAENRGYQADEKYGSLYHLIETLTNTGIFSPALLSSYTKEEIEKIQSFISQERDELFTYIGLLTLSDRYLAQTHDRKTMELPQERFLIIAMTLMQNEPKEKRLALIEEAYWALSNLYMTVATPTLANAGKTYGQLSSCFIDTVEDDLRSIYDSNTDVATLSKHGGGIGVYLGKVRPRGSDIKGFKGVSSGVMPWMKQLNNTAVSVDQLGQRKGAIAVYLDVWHKDIFSFLDAKLNNGDERLRTHDLFTGVCLPDLFMEKVQNREEWHLFDPHEVRSVMNYSLEDFYDEEKGSGSFREKYEECVREEKLSRETIPAIEIMKRIMISQLETGTPYMFYRDTVNRANPNKHKGMIYGSNLCSEIAQNMSATTLVEETTDGGTIVIRKEMGDFVVCNLSSVSLATAVKADVLPRLVKIQMRMLDNVIDLNTIPVPQAKYTNEKYRAVGLGTFGLHHLLALEGISWESDDAVEYNDRLYENIAYYAISASMELAKEKGSYPVFEGSEWENGRYFEDRGYTSDRWEELRAKVQEHGMRNGYVMAVAPNSSTSIIAGSSASIDPIFRKEYSEEKKDYKIPVTAPDLTPQTNWYYKSAYHINQNWSIKQNAKRQRHIDQAVSFNLYVQNDIRAKDLLDLHLNAWSEGLKTTYYVRSTSGDAIDECESCHS